MLLAIQLLAFISVIYASQKNVEVQNILRSVQNYDKFESQQSRDALYRMFGQSLGSANVNSTGCSCKNYNCGCCLYVKVKEIKLDDTVCANFSYLPAPEYGISFSLTVDKTTIINETISARNPPPICVDVPELKDLASLCLEFKDLNVTKKSFSGCVYLAARLAKVRIENIKLGCFVIPPKNQIDQARVNII